jgi:RNA polymerase sigma-70 factor (ECF subfamily)
LFLIYKVYRYNILITFEGISKSENIVKKGIKAIRLRKYFSPKLGRALGQKTTTLPVLEEKMFKEALGHELDNLDHKHREVFILRHIDGLSIKEIAEVIDINEGTVKSRLFYAIKKLANELKMFEIS